MILFWRGKASQTCPPISLFTRSNQSSRGWIDFHQTYRQFTATMWLNWGMAYSFLFLRIMEYDYVGNCKSRKSNEKWFFFASSRGRFLINSFYLQILPFSAFKDSTINFDDNSILCYPLNFSASQICLSISVLFLVESLFFCT